MGKERIWGRGTGEGVGGTERGRKGRRRKGGDGKGRWEGMGGERERW